MEDLFEVQQFEPRSYFAARLEPSSGVIHGAGQSPDAFSGYDAVLAPHGLAPGMFMAYFGLGGFTDRALERLQAYNAGRDRPLIAQIGLSMTTDGQPEKAYEARVAAGEFDGQIDTLCRVLNDYGHPVLLRIGYECTGPWNGYTAESYVEAFRRIARRIHAEVPNAATVWCVEGGWTHNCLPYYPGDAFVDWWAIDLFAPDHFSKCAGFMEEAAIRRKPVLIGECTPRRVGIADPVKAWEEWFSRFFHFIAKYPHLKGFSYINWDWQHYPQWHDWGNARIQDNPEVLAFWIGNLSRPIFIHHPTSVNR